MDQIPPFAIGQQWPDFEVGQWWIVQLEAPFVMARAEERGQSALYLYPWPYEVFRALPQERQIDIAQNMATYYYRDVETDDEDEDDELSEALAPSSSSSPVDDMSIVADARTEPPPYILADDEASQFTCVIRLRPPYFWARVVEGDEGDELVDFVSVNGDKIDKDAIEEMVAYYEEFCRREDELPDEDEDDEDDDDVDATDIDEITPVDDDDEDEGPRGKRRDIGEKS